MGFIFGGDTGTTPDDVARKREVANALAMRALRTPKGVGGGLNAIGQALLYRKMSGDANKAEAAGRAASSERFAPLMQALGMGGGQPAPAATAAPPQGNMAPPQGGNVPAGPPPGYDQSVTYGGDGMGNIPDPMQALPRQGQPPIQTAQAPMPQAQPQQGGFANISMGDAYGVMSDQWATPEQKKIAGEVFKMKFQQLDPKYKAELQKLERENDPELIRKLKVLEARALGRVNEGFAIRQENRADERTIEAENRANRAKANEAGYNSLEEVRDAGGTPSSQAAMVKVDEAKQSVMKSAKSGVDILTTLDSLYKDSGVADITGPIEQWRSSTFQSEDGNRALTKHNQVKGQAFLEAFERLKGGGPITDIEGTKGTQAIQRIERALTEKEYKAAVAEFYENARTITQRRLRALGVPESQWPDVVKRAITVEAINMNGGGQPANNAQKSVKEMSEAELEALANGQ